MEIEKEQAILDLKLLRDKYCKTIPAYQKSINYVLNELEKKDEQILEIKEFLEREQLELHDYDNNYDLSYEGKGRMYLVDELLKEYFTKKVEGK